MTTPLCFFEKPLAVNNFSWPNREAFSLFVVSKKAFLYCKVMALILAMQIIIRVKLYIYNAIDAYKVIITLSQS